MMRFSRVAGLLAVSVFLASCGQSDAPPAKNARTVTAVFAGGCFWCLESDFEKLEGVVSAESGYAGGSLENPTYEQVGAGDTGHIESVRVTYIPDKVSYTQLLDYFWHHIDPTVKDRQFCDVGAQYRSAIFYLDEDQKRAAVASKAALIKKHGFPEIYTEIVPSSPFYSAEDYHQDYYKKNRLRYNFYRSRCGRDQRVEEVWGVHSKE